MTFDKFQEYVISYEGREPDVSEYLKYLAEIEVAGYVNQLRETLIKDVHNVLVADAPNGKLPFNSIQEKYIRQQIIDRCNSAKEILKERISGQK